MPDPTLRYTPDFHQIIPYKTISYTFFRKVARFSLRYAYGVNGESINLLFCSGAFDAAEMKDKLETSGIKTFHFLTLDKAMIRLESGRYDTLLLLLDGGDGDIDLLDKLNVVKKLDPDLQIVAICKTNSIAVERKARLEGVFYYLVEPVEENELVQVLKESARFRHRKVGRRAR